MLIGLEERKLFKKSFPRDPIVLSSIHQVFGNLHGFLKFGDHNISGCQSHVIGRIHGWERRGDDREDVTLFGCVKQHFVMNCKGNKIWVVFDFAKMDWVVVRPFS